MITEEEILDLGFVKDEKLSTDEIAKYDWTFKREDLNPLYTYMVYTLYWDLVLDIFNLIGQISQNNHRVYYTNRYDNTVFETQEQLRTVMSLFLRKDLKGSPLLKDLIK